MTGLDYNVVENDYIVLGDPFYYKSRRDMKAGKELFIHHGVGYWIDFFITSKTTDPVLVATINNFSGLYKSHETLLTRFIKENTKRLKMDSYSVQTKKMFDVKCCHGILLIEMDDKILESLSKIPLLSPVEVKQWQLTGNWLCPG